MASYKELLAQQEKLAKQLAEAREKELSAALEKINSLISDYGIEPERIFGDHIDQVKKEAYEAGRAAASYHRPVKAAPAAAADGEKLDGRKGPRGPVAPKYRNAETGETWSGRGIKPKWIAAALAGGKKLEDFLIPA